MDIHEYADSRKLSVRQVLDYTTGVNPLGSSNKAKHAIRKGAGHLDVFPDRRMTYLKRYLCARERLEADCIVFGAGSTCLLDLLLRIGGPRVGILSPLSSVREETLRAHYADIRRVRAGEGRPFSVDPEKLLEVMKEVDVLIVSHPHDMTGAVISPDGLSLLIEGADRLGRVLVIDEAYRDYTDLGSPIREAAASASTVVLRTFSLFHGLAGLRFGYAAGAKRLVEEMSAARPFVEVNGLAPHAAMLSLKDEGFRERSMRFIEDEKSYLRGKIAAIKGVELVETSCNFVLLALSVEEDLLRASFMERKILVDTFSCESGETYIRLPMGGHKANAQFVRALAQNNGGNRIVNRRAKALCLVMAWVLISILALAVPMALAGQKEIRILHVNDFHGYATEQHGFHSDELLGGIAYLAWRADVLKREKPGLLLAAGDMIQGNNWANLFQGKPVIEVMNEMGFDAMVVGNHEFDYGQAVLKERIKEARFPVLGANVQGMEGLKPYIIREIEGVKIAIIGVVTEDLPVTTHPKNVVGLKILSPINVVERYVKELRSKVDIILVLSHIGINVDMLLAERVKGIDVIVGGHTHTKLAAYLTVGSTVIVQAWEHGLASGCWTSP